MNDILVLKGQLQSRKHPGGGGLVYKKTIRISAAFVRRLRKQLEDIRDLFRNENLINGVMVDVHYKRVVPKSSRITSLLTDGKPGGAARSIRGARFEHISLPDGTVGVAHVFTHFVSFDVMESSIGTLKLVEEVLKSKFGDEATFKLLEKAKKGKLDLERPGKKMLILETIKDLDVLSKFSATKGEYPDDKTAVVSFYDTGIAAERILKSLGIAVPEGSVLDGNFIQLRGSDIRKLNVKAPYLISMSSVDLTKVPKCEYSEAEKDTDAEPFPSPKGEPTIGVLDTVFDADAYFSEWVKYENCLPGKTRIGLHDKAHGTAVSSIIVDGPRLNPWLDDGCGRFQVRHFGVATSGPSSSFEILKRVREVVSAHPEIKVWNLSLGSDLEIRNNSVSPVGAELDRIQKKLGIIFVVAGTNVPIEETGREDMKIGAPADSLNSLVVNAVDNNGKVASYSRIGPVLSFFYKPDICYYGGDGSNARTGIRVCTGVNDVYMCGTSIAAPWIARKLAYLIEIMGLPVEVAKGLIIDSAARWDVHRHEDLVRKGYGLVPIRIDSVLRSEDDEIKFIITGSADEYETHTYEIPVPVSNGAHPYYAKATLVYFPECDRNQGVDYTITEMDLHLGRAALKDGRPCIVSINKNTQDNDADYGPLEQSARKLFRKWDNVKHIAEELKPRVHPKKASMSQMWGLKILTKDRRQSGVRDRIKFGVIITLKAMDRINRHHEFIDLCNLHRWIVDPVVPRARAEAYQQAKGDVEWREE